MKLLVIDVFERLFAHSTFSEYTKKKGFTECYND